MSRPDVQTFKVFKWNINLLRSEVIALRVGVAIVGLIGLLALAIPCFSDWRQFEMLGEAERLYQKTYKPGEWVTLDKGEDENAVVTDKLTGWTRTYDAGLLFSGKMMFRVISSRLYTNPAQSGIDLGSKEFFGESYYDSAHKSDYEFLLCDVEIRNVNARSESGSYRDSSLFLASNIVGLNPASEVVYFTGQKADADDRELNYLSLAPGETKLISIGFAVPAHFKGSVHIDPGVYGLSKYRVELNIEDER